MNRIKEVLQQKGIRDLRPTDQVLDQLGVKIHTWIKWVDGSKDPELVQLPIIAELLECEVSDLIVSNPSVYAKN
jgi:transcriptional regulator with XRE-family HTH domain